MGGTSPSDFDQDRRSAIRFPLALGVRYSVLRRGKGGVAETGTGRTIDVSSSGLRFTAERALEAGLRVEVFIDWPLLLDGGVQLQLIASGTVVRSNGTEVALRIQRHDFRTRGGRPKSA